VLATIRDSAPLPMTQDTMWSITMQLFDHASTPSPESYFTYTDNNNDNDTELHRIVSSSIPISTVSQLLTVSIPATPLAFAHTAIRVPRSQTTALNLESPSQDSRQLIIERQLISKHHCLSTMADKVILHVHKIN
jgi:hypothetical protein